MNNAAILLAAGQGTRMQGTTDDKTLSLLGGKPAFLHSVRAFDQSRTVGRLLIVHRDNEQRQLMAKVLADCPPAHLTCAWVLGGARRQDSVLNALNALPADIDFVFIHDAARPLLSPALLQTLLDTARRDQAAAPAQRVSDTIKRSPLPQAGVPAVLEDLPRHELWAIQTPQTFAFGLIREAYRQIDRRGLTITDDTAALAPQHHPVTLIENPNPNPKLTTPADWHYLNTLLCLPPVSPP